MDSVTLKTVAVLAIIFGCFAVLYPKFFHPIILNLFGLAGSPEPKDKMGPPPMRLRPDGLPEDRHFRSGPHPGMRASAELNKQAGQSTSKGGMMTFILPLYAVGIVIYLIYTLSKMFGKKDPQPTCQYTGLHLDASTEDTLQRTARRTKRELEKLLKEAEESKMSESELEVLRHRLIETESQMKQILQVMQAANITNVDDGKMTWTDESLDYSADEKEQDDDNDYEKQETERPEKNAAPKPSMDNTFPNSNNKSFCSMQPSNVLNVSHNDNGFDHVDMCEAGSEMRAAARTVGGRTENHFSFEEGQFDDEEADISIRQRHVIK